MSSSRDWMHLVRAADDPAAAAPHRERLLTVAVELGSSCCADVTACSITQLVDGSGVTRFWSSPLALDLDEVQYRTGDGPCLAAAREHRVQEIADTRSCDRFPEFAAAAAARGVLSTLSLPAHDAALNVYATAPQAFTAHSTRASEQLLARCVGRVLSGSPAPRPSPSDVAAARDRGRTVRDAVRQLQESYGLTEADAFAKLVARGVDENRSLHALAADMLGGGA